MSDNIIPAYTNNHPRYWPVSTNEIGDFIFPPIYIINNRIIRRRALLSDISDARGTDGILFPHTPSRNAISPCGLHCVAARCGATTAPLLRSFPVAFRQGDSASLISGCLPARWWCFAVFRLPSGKVMMHCCLATYTIMCCIIAPFLN